MIKDFYQNCYIEYRTFTNTALGNLNNHVPLKKNALDRITLNLSSRNQVKKSCSEQNEETVTLKVKLKHLDYKNNKIYEPLSLKK